MTNAEESTGSDVTEMLNLVYWVTELADAIRQHSSRYIAHGLAKNITLFKHPHAAVTEIFTSPDNIPDIVVCEFPDSVIGREAVYYLAAHLKFFANSDGETIPVAAYVEPNTAEENIIILESLGVYWYRKQFSIDEEIASILLAYKSITARN